MTKIDTLIKGLEDLNVGFNEEAISRFKDYKELLKEWNEKINLTAITDDDEIDIKHFLDSIMPNMMDIFQGNKKIIDIGTGAGFPGIPLKIVNDGLDVTLLDSLNKRINFLNLVIEELKLKDIRAIHARAEELSRKKEYREEYDICISRAVASLNTLSEYCMPFVKKGGYFISMKGPEVEEELKMSQRAIELLGGEVIECRINNIPGSDINHSLIVIKKTKNTPDKYPRGGGKPRKNPL